MTKWKSLFQAWSVLGLVVLTILVKECQSTNYYVGAGRADITGPAADVNMMGYANPGQTSHGIHMRQFSRAFIFASSANGDRTVFVNIDACWSSGAVKREVVKNLSGTYGTMYTEKNLCISGTHTHSGAGGFSQYLLFDITALGFNKQGFEAIVSGIVQSINQAHKSFQPADIFISSGTLLDSNINRSPSAYLNNPGNERSKYKYNVDKTMVVMKIVDANGKGFGMISWFAVHCTSMNNTNQMLSPDNKGYAAQLFEKTMNSDQLPGKGSFVAAFAQSNEGDVSPNTKGPHCTDSGKPCDILTSTCHGKNELCVAAGPGRDMFESTKIIGTNQFKKALDLYNGQGTKLSGKVDYRHTFVDMTNVTVTFDNGTKVQTCKPAMGFSFAAGTTDGPGAFDFKQGDTKGNPFWNIIRDFIKDPTDAQVQCHHPKPILLDTGEIKEPYLWQPQIVPIQLLRIGSLVIIPVPGEFSTMSGRRLRDAVNMTLSKEGFLNDTIPVIAGLANEYSDYITTYEEYQIQRYEGGSTIFGPHTLSAYIMMYSKLATDMAQGKPSNQGQSPPDQLSKQLSFLPGVIYDSSGLEKSFGDVDLDALSSYMQGSEVKVRYVSANPRNNLRSNSTFLTVELKVNSTSWQVVHTDASWETRFKWIRTNEILGESQAEIKWEIPSNQKTGTYRIRHFGTAKSLFGKYTDFTGQSKEFVVKTASYK